MKIPLPLFMFSWFIETFVKSYEIALVGYMLVNVMDEPMRYVTCNYHDLGLKILNNKVTNG
jgi:hypothetical protein